MKNLDKKVYYSILFSYYGNLLTDKQKEMFNDYYNEDYSLGEIASELGISRNAVWDTLEKTTKLLDTYEDNLKMYQNELSLKEKLDKLKDHVDDEGIKIIKEIEEME